MLIIRLAIIGIFLTIKTSFAADYLSEIKGQYQSLFAEAEHKPKQGGISHYKKELHQKLPSYEGKPSLDLLPKAASWGTEKMIAKIL